MFTECLYLFPKLFIKLRPHLNDALGYLLEVPGGVGDGPLVRLDVVRGRRAQVLPVAGAQRRVLPHPLLLQREKVSRQDNRRQRLLVSHFSTAAKMKLIMHMDE